MSSGSKWVLSWLMLAMLAVLTANAASQTNAIEQRANERAKEALRGTFAQQSAEKYIYGNSEKTDQRFITLINRLGSPTKIEFVRTDFSPVDEIPTFALSYFNAIFPDEPQECMIVLFWSDEQNDWLINQMTCYEKVDLEYHTE